MFQLIVRQSSLHLLWEESFVEDLSRINLRIDETPPREVAVTSLDGNSLTWFESGTAGWSWLRRHDGLMSFWAREDLSIEVSIQHGLPSPSGENVPLSRIDVSAVLSNRRSRSEAVVSVVEALATMITERCDIVRGFGNDEELLERLNHRDRNSELEWCGYWIALPKGELSDNQARAIERVGGSIERKRSAVIVKLADWPWEVADRSIHTLSVLLDSDHT